MNHGYFYYFKFYHHNLTKFKIVNIKYDSFKNNRFISNFLKY